MPRSIEITVPSKETDALVNEIKDINGLVGLQVQRNASVKPPGDVILANVVNRGLNPLIKLLDKHDVGTREGTSVSTSEPTSLVSASSITELTRDNNEATWEEMETTAGNESNMTWNMLAMMFLVGVIAALGITSNAIHVVVGAMVIAPGFVPITRMALGLNSESAAFSRGLLDTLKAYGTLALGAAVTTIGLLIGGKDPIIGTSTYLEPGELLSYWTSITLTSVTISAAASIAGALLIATNRAVLTGGVMIALALIPCATIATMALLIGEYDRAFDAFLRWLIDIACVFVFSCLVLAWKKKQIHKRSMNL